MLQELRKLHPRNRLGTARSGLNRASGGTARAGRGGPDRGPGDACGDDRPRIPGEEALWRYKRGAARVALGRARRWRGPTCESATSADAQTWVQGRARVELARLALQRGDRSAAAGEARQAETLCEQGQDPVCVEEARKLLRTSDGR